jgi:hypothetical protein
MGHPVAYGGEDAASFRSRQEFYARFPCAACLVARTASACGAQCEVEFDPHSVVQPFRAAPVALAYAELEATDVR